ncbi:MAG: hypothetical protein JW750_07275 [Anaerolineaceae bacterium]|nr:hypothetical protein [Anaerolineaceae bacterium]
MMNISETIIVILTCLCCGAVALVGIGLVIYFATTKQGPSMQEEVENVTAHGVAEQVRTVSETPAAVDETRAEVEPAADPMEEAEDEPDGGIPDPEPPELPMPE